MYKLVRSFVFFCYALFAVTVHAHAPGLSSVAVTVGADSTTVSLSMAPQDAEVLTPIDTDKDADLSTQEWEQGIANLAELIAQRTEVIADQKTLLPTRPARAYLDENNNVQVILRYIGGAQRLLQVHAGFLDRLPVGHRQAYSLRDQKGHLLSEQVLTRDRPNLLVDLSGGSAKRPSGLLSSIFNDYLRLGIEHILTGYDHLLFLFGLLLATRSAWDYFKIISCFTLAHSLTLALATIELVVLPANIVEPAIAASIAYVGVENLLRGDRISKRGVLTFAFGLVHGFGFAGALQSVGINNADYGVSIPLFAFNVGVELGQISVAALVWPIFQALRNNERALRSRWQSACSWVIVLIGTYWVYARTLAG